MGRAWTWGCGRGSAGGAEPELPGGSGAGAGPLSGGRWPLEDGADRPRAQPAAEAAPRGAPASAGSCRRGQGCGWLRGPCGLRAPPAEPSPRRRARPRCEGPRLRASHRLQPTAPALPRRDGENEGRGILWCRSVLVPERVPHLSETGVRAGRNGAGARCSARRSEEVVSRSRLPPLPDLRMGERCSHR